ncbi:MAG: PIG-L family deacetylase [Bacteroidia bacterium]|nr:PIG-L family deacetylase [Bacteroidia bacterium]
MNILAIGAHFDDIELGCGGALARHVANGDTVIAYVATLSGYKNADNKVIRPNEIALKEGQEAMRILGVELICGTFNTLELEFAEPLNVQILRIVEERKIDRVYMHWTGDVHHDHISLAHASLHACRHVKRILMYRSNWYHSGKVFNGNYYIDITEHWEKKESSILAHESELGRVNKKWVSFFRNEAENAGQRIGVPLAEVFEVVKWIE